MKCTDTDHADSVFVVNILIQTEKLFKSHVQNIEVGENQSVNETGDRKPLEHFRFRTITPWSPPNAECHAKKREEFRGKIVR